MATRSGLFWAWGLNLGLPAILLALAYGCGGKAYLVGERLHPESTALEGRRLAEGLAAAWDGSARLVGVEGWRVRRDGRFRWEIQIDARTGKPIF